MAAGLGACLGAAVAWARGPGSQWHKKMLDLCITAALNILDFYSDLLVILKYACVVDSGLSVKCGEDEMSQTCQPHYWWFGRGVTMLVISNIAQSFFWMRSIAHRFRFERPVCAAFGLFATAFSQINYLVDIYIAAEGLAFLQKRHDGNIDMRIPQLFREGLTKCLESSPQLYFQSYVLFVLGAHGEPAQMASVVISILSLAYGGTKIFARHPATRQIVHACAYKRTIGSLSLALISLWLALDLAWRIGATAVVLTEASRPVGTGMLLAFYLAFIVCFATANTGAIGSRICLAVVSGTLVGHLTPGTLLLLGSEFCYSRGRLGWPCCAGARAWPAWPWPLGRPRRPADTRRCGRLGRYWSACWPARSFTWCCDPATHVAN